MAASDTARDGGPQEILRLVVGRIGRAHGLREAQVGVVGADLDLRFAPGAELDTDPAERGPLTVAGGRVQSGRLLLSFEGVADRTAAEALRNTLLIVEADPDELPDDPEEYYDHHLVGLRVVTVGGLEVGTVGEMLHLPTQDVFAVRRPDGREALIPFVAKIVPEVDLGRGVVLVDPPPGLLELADPTERAAKPESEPPAS